MASRGCTIACKSLFSVHQSYDIWVQRAFNSGGISRLYIEVFYIGHHNCVRTIASQIGHASECWVPDHSEIH